MHHVQQGCYTAVRQGKEDVGSHLELSKSTQSTYGRSQGCTMNVELPMRAVAITPSPSVSMRAHSREVRTCVSATSVPAHTGTLPPFKEIDTTATPPVCGPYHYDSVSTITMPISTITMTLYQIACARARERGRCGVCGVRFRVWGVGFHGVSMD